MMGSVTQVATDHAHEIARQYTRALGRRLGDRLVSVVLYGSVARGEHTPSSDIDLLIVARGLPESRRARNRLLVEIEEELYPVLASLYHSGGYVELSTKIKTPEEAEQFTPLYLDMTEDAVLLYDRDGFFKTVLDRLRERLQTMGAKRVRQGKVWYWDLKPDYQWGEVIEI
jgi:predicted nucleotidyltransferase